MAHLLTCLAADAPEAAAVQAALDARSGATACASVKRLDLAPEADAPGALHLLLAGSGGARSPVTVERALDRALRRARPGALPVALHLVGGADVPHSIGTLERSGELPAALLPLGRHALEERLALLVAMQVRHVALVAHTPVDRALACRVAQRCALLIAAPDAIDHCLAHYRVSGWLPFEANPSAGGLTVSA